MWDKITKHIDNWKIEKKLRILFICCVLIPLIVTDGIVLMIIYREDQSSKKYEMINAANAAEYNFISNVEAAMTVANNIYTNQYLNDFLNRSYGSSLEYFDAFRQFVSGSLLIGSINAGGMNATMYSENDTLLNGREFARLDEGVKSRAWYKSLTKRDTDKLLYIYYDRDSEPVVSPKKKISLIRRLNYYQRDSYEKVLKLDLDYSGFVNDLVRLNYETPIYVLSEGNIIYSNRGYSNIGNDFSDFKLEKEGGYSKKITMYGVDITFQVLRRQQDIGGIVRNNALLIAVLVLINVILPWFFMRRINTSFTRRISTLSKAFEDVNKDRLAKIEQVKGSDEIGELMRNYNRMAGRTNDLIQTVYKDRLKEQEINIARQSAELMALHSQINPHFLFNVLDSIRMHSVLKKEDETAHMVESLAVMMRKYVDWGTDYVSIDEEFGLVHAYLELQRYRFGDRLDYEMEIDEECKGYKIPKLTVVTFVENACVHGVEAKSSRCWIFVRAAVSKGSIRIEVEDTGNGIDEEMLHELRYNMAHAGIASLKKKGHIGIMNACLRLRMMTEDHVGFEIESEKGAGTTVSIILPLE